MTQETKIFLRNTAGLVIPMALQNLINTAVNAADVIMLGRAGKIALSASSLGGQVYFILSLIFFGLTSGASVLTAQYWGKRDIGSIEKILALTIKVSFVIALFFTAIVMCIPETIMQLFSHEPEVIEQGAIYLRIIALSYTASSITCVYLNVMRSVERVIVSTVVYLFSLIINVILNAILIFGLFGLPPLGVAGAAIATAIARFFELIFVIIYAKKFNDEIKVRLRYLMKTDKILRKDFVTYSMPVVINELMWGLGISLLSAIIGHMGSSVAAANSVAQVVRQLAMVVLMGLANAAAIMLGKVIGSGDTALAQRHASRFIKLSLSMGVVSALLITAISPFVRMFMDLDAQTSTYLGYMLFVISYFVIAQAISLIMIVGIYRSGGDTKIGLIFDMCTLWGFALPVGALAAFVWKLPVWLVYMILCSDEILKIPLCIWRYRTNKWLKNVTR